MNYKKFTEYKARFILHLLTDHRIMLMALQPYLRLLCQPQESSPPAQWSYETYPSFNNCDLVRYIAPAISGISLGNTTDN